MVRAIWQGDVLVVTPISKDEERLRTLPDWVYNSIAIIGVAVYEGVGYALDEQTARARLEF